MTKDKVRPVPPPRPPMEEIKEDKSRPILREIETGKK